MNCSEDRLELNSTCDSNVEGIGAGDEQAARTATLINPKIGILIIFCFSVGLKLALEHSAQLFEF